MRRLGPTIFVSIVAGGMPISAACADMLVLKSNVAEYAVGKMIKGNSIPALTPGQEVQVFLLEERRTILFEGDRVQRPPNFGTRSIHRDIN